MSSNLTLFEQFYKLPILYQIVGETDYGVNWESSQAIAKFVYQLHEITRIWNTIVDGILYEIYKHVQDYLKFDYVM